MILIQFLTESREGTAFLKAPISEEITTPHTFYYTHQCKLIQLKRNGKNVLLLMSIGKVCYFLPLPLSKM